jgi:phage N-6-adenine-methyltransferase
MGVVGRPRTYDLTRVATTAERQARFRVKRAQEAARGRKRASYLAQGQRQDWGTPPEIFDPLHDEFAFSVDVCASPWNAKCPRFYTEAEDGLAQPWDNEICWMNPPFGREIVPWIRKAALSVHHGTTTVALVPARTDTLSWWQPYIAPLPPADIRFLPGRIRFLQRSGPGEHKANFPCAVVIFRPR